MAIIQLDTKTRVKGAEHSWELQQRIRRTRNGKPVVEWRAMSWHASLGQAVQSFAEDRLRRSDAEGVAEVLAEVKRIRAALSEALPDVWPLTSAEKSRFDEYGRQLWRAS